MKNIEVLEGAWCIKSLYQAATTPATRALVGYMVKTNKVDSTLFGGALYLLKDLEECGNKQIYYLELCTNADKAKRMVYIAESARKGKFKRFALSRKAIRKTLKCIK